MAHMAHGLLAALLLAVALAAYEPTLDWRAIDAAVAIGQSRVESTKVRFHAAYRIDVGSAPVDYIEVVTPFRRVVLAAEARARLGDRRFGQREALATLAEAGHALELIVELTFHPLNTYIGVPDYTVTLLGAASEAPIEPEGLQRIPRFGPRFEGGPVPYPQPGVTLPGGSQPLLGGTLIARFDGDLLDPTGTYEAAIGEAGTALARARVELGQLR